LKRSFVFVACALMQFPAHADSTATSAPTTYAEVGLWRVSTFPISHTCIGTMALGDIATSIEYNAKTGHIVLYLANKNATSVAEDQKVKLTVTFTTGDRADHGWGDSDFTAHVNDDGSRLFVSEPFNVQMLDDVARQDYLILLNGDKLVSGAKLDKSAEMVAMLRQCSLKAAGLNENDPFIP
jgi:hypothetical protein